MKKVSVRQRLSQAVAVTAAMTVMVAGAVAPSFAAPVTGADLEVEVAIVSDAPADFDANNNPGNDAGPNNNIVRVNDTVTYHWNYKVASNEAENLTLSMTLPKGMAFNGIPAYCLDGSSLTPESVGTPTIPLTASSINELTEQTLTCRVPTPTVANASNTANVTAKVLNVVHHGTALTPVAASITAMGVDNPVPVAGTLPTVTASSGLKWDISKLAANAVDPDSGYAYGPNYEPCPWDRSRDCVVTGYSVLIGAPT